MLSMTTISRLLAVLGALTLAGANAQAPPGYIQDHWHYQDTVTSPAVPYGAALAPGQGYNGITAPGIGHQKTEDGGASLARCQAPKTAGGEALTGCPKGTVFVSQTNPAAQFKTVTAALQSLDDADSSVRTVLIDTGIYNEKVVVLRKNPLVFLGVAADPSNPSANGVVIWQSSYVNQNGPSLYHSNCDAVTLGVGPNNGGMGSTDFKAYNINFVQRQFRDGKEVTQEQLGPSAALCVQNSRASFYGCGFSSYQDTVFVGAGSQALFSRSIVKGMTDQLYGEGRAWFEQCLLLSRACMGGIAAWRGKAGDQKAGVYISNSRIAVSPDAQTLKPMQGRCHLGRPWNAFAQTVYLNNFMTDIIAPEGFKTWNKQQSNFDPQTTRFFEYNSSGPGATPNLRDHTIQHMLTPQQAATYTYQRIFDAPADWIDLRTLENPPHKHASKKRHHAHKPLDPAHLT